MNARQLSRARRPAIPWVIAGIMVILSAIVDHAPALAAGPYRCPVLYYHDIPSEAGLEAHVAAFVRAGYIPTRLSNLLDAIDGVAPLPPGCMVLTFDDALQSQHHNALPVLTRWSISGTFFILPNFRDGVHTYMNYDEIREVAASGQEIGSHTLNHPNLPALRRVNPGSYWAEIDLSRQMIEDLVGFSIDLFAYPNGAFDATTATDISALGYRAAVSTIAGAWHSDDQRFAMRRITANPWEAPSTVLQRLAG